MLWLALLVLVVEAQEIRIPAYNGRPQNKPVIRVVPSEGVLIRVRKPEQTNTGPIIIRPSTVTRIQPVLLTPRVTPRVNLVRFLSQMGLRRMAALIDFAELQDILKEAGPVTLFVPTDEAFSLTSAPSDQRRLRDFILQHVVRGRIMPEDVKNDITLPSLRSGKIPLRLNVYDDGLMLCVSGSQFLDDARDADNVRIQPIDKVLFPISNEDLVTEVKLTFPKLNEYLMKTSLGSQLISGTFTFFAPTDEAFESLTPDIQEKLLSNSTLLTKVLLNHIVPGTQYSAVLAHGFSLRTLGGEPIHFTNRRGLILANGVPLVKADVSVSNGVIHALNRLLLPPELHFRRRPATAPPPPFKINTLPDLVPPVPEEYLPVPVFMEPPPPIPRSITKTISTPLQLPDGRRMTFSTANSLLRRSLLLSTLRNNGSAIGYTILVPTDNAFKDLGQNTLDRLRRNSRLLRRMLLAQMMEGKLNLTDADDKDQPVKSLGGTVIISSLNGGNSLMVGGARVLSIRQAADGMVLVTDKVILPSSSRNVADALQPFSEFKKIIKTRPKIQDTINSDGSVYTIFAPNDAALSTLPKYQLEDPAFISELFWSHVVPGAYYRNRLSPGLRLTTVRGNIIVIHRTPSGGVFVNEKPVIGEEIITGNGVVHPIGSLLFVPQTALQAAPTRDSEFDDGLNRIGQEFNATLFLEWMKKAHLQNQLRSPILRRGCTLFLPTNTALQNMSPTLRTITLQDPERLNKFIRFHISPQILSWNNVHDNAFMPTLLPIKRIRCNIYAKDRMPGIMTVSGCRVKAIRPVASDSNVTVAILDEAMQPPAGDIALTIAKTPMLTNFSKILSVAGGKDVFENDGPYTLFAPNSCAFSDIDPELYKRLIANRKLALDFVKQYLVRSCLYSNGLYDGLQLLTEAGTTLIVQITPDCILISGSKMLYGDVGTTNGVLHVIASILPS